jgi:hypothetical protein
MSIDLARKKLSWYTRVNVDAICKIYKIDNSARAHMLDALLFAAIGRKVFARSTVYAYDNTGPRFYRRIVWFWPYVMDQRTAPRTAVLTTSQLLCRYTGSLTFFMKVAHLHI